MKNSKTFSQYNNTNNIDNEAVLFELDVSVPTFFALRFRPRFPNSLSLSKSESKASFS